MDGAHCLANPVTPSTTRCPRPGSPAPAPFRFVTPRLEGLRTLERSKVLRPSRRGVTKRVILSRPYSYLVLLCEPL
jgi:hypothetical protein